MEVIEIFQKRTLMIKTTSDKVKQKFKKITTSFFLLILTLMFWTFYKLDIKILYWALFFGHFN